MHTMTRWLAIGFLGLATGSLSACGGGSSSPGGLSGVTPPPPAPAPAPPSPGGIWRGTNPATNLQLLGLVTETGEYHFLQEDGVQYFGTVAVAANGAASGTFTGVVPFGFTFPDGSLTGTGTITSGTVTARSRLQLSTSFWTSRGTTTTSAFTLNFDPLYNRPSSLATIAGNYRDPDTGAVINVNGNGVIFSQDPLSGCVINGSVALINASFNAYRIEYRFSGCRGADVALNGTTARGLGTLDNTVSPERAVIGVVNETAGYSLIGAYPRT
ncbi:MAG: hypothetical protein O9284_05640 [Steroidobacteraceae bacterium]|jgi:hypothetical protein|nr:hypothetical protein [Steroidobacteraceae bacterium]